MTAKTANRSLKYTDSSGSYQEFNFQGYLSIAVNESDRHGNRNTYRVFHTPEGILFFAGHEDMRRGKYIGGIKRCSSYVNLLSWLCSSSNLEEHRDIKDRLLSEILKAQI